MNREEIQLPLIKVKRFELEPALRSIFQTIIFNRSLHSKIIRPRDIDCEVFGISYAQTDNKEVARKVNEGIREFRKKMEEFKTAEGVASISFYTLGESSGWKWNPFAKEERFYWEKWMIPVSLLSSSFEQGMENSRRIREHRQRAEMLRTSLIHIIKKVNEKRHHIPPLDSRSRNEATSKEMDRLGCFPFEISYSKSDKSRWTRPIMNALQKPPNLMS